MAIKGGSILTVGNQTVIDRIQTAGPGQVNIPTEKINELGNYKSVATVRDVPDLQFTYDSLDVSTETEALLSGGGSGNRKVADGATTAADPTLTSATAAFAAGDVGKQVIVTGAGNGQALVSTIVSVTDATTVVLADPATNTVAGASVRVGQNGFDLSVGRPIDVASQFKAGKDATDPFAVISSVAVPFLSLSSMSYKFGLRDNASQSGTLNGDTIFYNPGPTFIEETTGSGAAGQTVATGHPAFQSAEGDERRVLAVTVGSARLALGPDYTETYGAVAGGAAVTTVTLTAPVPATESIRIIYASPDAVQYPQSVHEDVTVKPAAVKGRDIEVYLGGYDPNNEAGSQANRVDGLQSAAVDWKVTLQKDEELGNYYATGQDFDTPAVTGSLDFKPRNPEHLMTRLRQMANVTDAEKVLGTATSQPLPLDVVIRNPDTHETVKRIHSPDARFTIPGFSGQVVQKLTVTIQWESDEGEMLIFAA